MKPELDRTWFIEFGKCKDWPWWKRGSFRSTMNGKRFRRWWWLGVCIAYVDMNLADFTKHVASGATEWREP